MSYPERMVLFLCLLAVVCGEVYAARQAPDSSDRISPDDTLTLGIILVSSEILDCDICGESSLRAIARLDQLNELDGMLAFIVPERPFETGESEYRIRARQALGFSLHNELHLPFFMLHRNVFQRPATRTPLVLTARIVDAPISAQSNNPLSLLGAKTAAPARYWVLLLHTGLVQLLLAFILLLSILIKHSRYKKIQARVAQRYESWHPRLSLATPEGRFQGMVWLIGVAALIYLLLTAFSVWLFSLLLLFVLFAVVHHAFSAVQVGEKGINNALVFIPWEEITSWKTDNKRNVLYLIHGDTPPRITSIGLPPSLQHPIQALLAQRVQPQRQELATPSH